MPPRIPTQSLQLASSRCSAATAASPLERALLACHSLLTFPSSSRQFSATTSRSVARNVSRDKQKYLEWMKTRGKELKHHKRGNTNYVAGDFAKGQPFPSNKTFTSYPVLSEDAREMIYKRVVEKEEPVMVVSADLGVDHRRVAAVVRMKAVEKEWERTVRDAHLVVLLHLICLPPLFYDDYNKNSISLEDSTMWLRNKLCEPL